MKKKLIISLSSFILAALLVVGFVYALFSSSLKKSLNFEFSALSHTAVVTETAGVGITFKNAGDSKTFQIEIDPSTSTEPFGYQIAITKSSDTDAGLAQSVLAYVDGELVGTVASAFSDGAAFTEGGYVFSPDRILNTKSGDKAQHTLKLVYHLGAASVNNGKTLTLNLATRASTLDVGAVAIVKTADEYEDVMRHLAAGQYADNFRIVLGASLTSSAAFTVTKPFVLDLNGYNLNAPLTVTDAASVICSYQAATVTGLTVNGASAFVNLGQNVTAIAPTLTNFSTDLAHDALLTDAKRAFAVGASGTASYTIDFANGNRAYLAKNAALATVSPIAVASISADGQLNLNAPSETTVVTMQIGSDALDFSVYGTTGTSAAVAELDALMDAQNVQKGTTSIKNAVAYNLLLPKILSGNARVEWFSDHPDVIATNGQYANTYLNGSVILTAKITNNNVVETVHYAVVVEAIKDNQAVFDAILDAYGALTFEEIGERHFIPTIAGNLDAQKAEIGYLTLPQEEQIKWDAVAALIADSGITSFDYAINPSSLFESDGALTYETTFQTISLKSGSTIHVALLTVTATFDTAPTSCQGQIMVYIDVASVQEAWRYFSSAYSDRSDIAINIRDDRYHNVSEDGANRTYTGANVYQYHGDATATVFGTADSNGVTTPLGKYVREGSFILPTQFTSISSLSNFSTNAMEVRVYYYFVYALSPVDSNVLDGGSDVLAADEQAVLLGQDFSSDFTLSSGATLSDVSESYNNFFLVDPSKLPSTSTSYTLKVGMYQADGSSFTRMDMQSFNLSIPGALHNDADGFADLSVFEAFWSAMNSSSATFATTSAKACPDNAGYKDTIIKKVASEIKKISVVSTAATPIEANGSVAGLASFNGLSELTVNGIASAPFLKSDAARISLENAMRSLVSLTKVDMRYCGLIDLDFAAVMTNLVDANFSNNATLTDIDGFLRLTHMTTLDVSGCGFNFTSVLDWNSPYQEASIFDALYYSSGKTKITYSYNSGSSDTVVVYASSRGALSAAALQAREYALSVETIDTAVLDRINLLKRIYGATGVEIGYRQLSGNVNKFRFAYTNEWSDSNVYAEATTSGSGSSVKAKLNKSSYAMNNPLRAYLETTVADGNKVVIQLIVIVNGSVGVESSDFFARNLVFTVQK